MKTVLITGATSGIGMACAKLFAMNNYQLIITGRRVVKLKNLAIELMTNFKVNVIPLCFDIQKNSEVVETLKTIYDQKINVDILINNAGLAAGFSTFQNGEISDWEQMIDTNLKGLLYVSRYIAPMMLQNGSGHIINIASIAGKEAYPKGNIYCATKAAVDSLSRTMRIDLLPYNIRVSNVAPGLVETEFSLVRYKGNEELASSPYKKIKPLNAEDIAETVFWIASRPAHVNISDVYITPTAQANTRDVFRVL